MIYAKVYQYSLRISRRHSKLFMKMLYFPHAAGMSAPCAYLSLVVYYRG